MIETNITQCPRLMDTAKPAPDQTQGSGKTFRQSCVGVGNAYRKYRSQLASLGCLQPETTLL